MKLVFIHGWGLDASLWDGLSALLPEYEQERVDLGFYSTHRQGCPPPFTGGARGGLLQQEAPSPAKTPGVAKAMPGLAPSPAKPVGVAGKGLLRKPKFLLPRMACPSSKVDTLTASAVSPKGERSSILIGHSLGFVHGLSQYQNWKAWVAVNSFPRFVKTAELPGCTSAAELRDIRLRLAKDPQKTLADFHHFIGAETPKAEPDAKALRNGLDELRDSDVGDTAARLSPGLVLASLQDPLVPQSTTQALAAGKELVWHDSASHILPQSDPAFCAYAIRSFLVQNDLNRL